MLRPFLLLLFVVSACTVPAQNNWRDTLFNGKAGIADTTGRIILPPVYDEVTPYAFNAFDWNTGAATSSRETVFIVRKGKLQGLFDAQGKQLLDVLYDEVIVDYADSGTYRIIAAKMKKRYAFFDPGGKPVTGFLFTAIDTGDFTNGIIAYVKRKGDKAFQLLDKKGMLHKEAMGL